MKVNVSILSNTLKPLDIVKELDKTNADAIHIDVMDGKFVDNKTWTTSEIIKLTKYSNLPLDVHLMVNNPSKYIEDYAMLNTNNITFHYEAVKDVNKVINEIKDYGLKVGIAVNPDTDVKNIYDYLSNIDIVLIMSVYPGKSGQVFINETLNKIKELKEYITKLLLIAEVFLFIFNCFLTCSFSGSLVTVSIKFPSGTAIASIINL